MSCIPQFISVQCVHKVAVWFVESVQGDSGGKVSILRGGSISHCETESLFGHVQLWLATEMERSECTNRQFVWTCPVVTGYWDGVVGMSRQTVCMDMSNCDWLLRWSGWNVQTVCMDMSSCDWLLRWRSWNVQTDSLYGHVQLWLATEMERLECTNRQFVWTCPVVTGYWDRAVGMSRQTVCMNMSNCDWLLRWSGWNVQTDSLYGHIQLWLATDLELLECRNIKTLWTVIKRREITDC